MANVQVDESQFLNLQGVEAAVGEILANPEARKLLLKARKIANPNVVIPELDAAAPVNAALENIQAQLAADKAERAAEKAEAAQAKQLADFERSWRRQKDSLRAKGWSDEGIAGVVSMAQERGIGDLEVAAAYFEKINPPPEPVQPSGSGAWGFMDAPASGEDTFMKAMVAAKGDDDGALNAEIRAALSDFRGQPGARR